MNVDGDCIVYSDKNHTKIKRNLLYNEFISTQSKVELQNQVIVISRIAENKTEKEKKEEKK
ncbi:hypothetical protein BLOT_002437 [Blomia tropicalis]|nr:hypothetical protein BLOT_002437 [Blomia tropicalis]